MASKITDSNTQPQLVLPHLQPKKSYSVPKRYEETRPVIIQSYTHKNILDLGHSFELAYQQTHALQQREAIKQAQDNVWREAELVKHQAVEATVKKLEDEHEKITKKLRQDHSAKLRDELICLGKTKDLQRLAEVEQTKKDAEKLQEEAVRRTEKLWEEKLLKAVENARVEERTIAGDNMAQQRKKHEIETEKLYIAMTHEKAEALRALELRKEQETLNAVQRVKEEQQRVQYEKLQNMKKLYDQQIAVLQSQINERKHEIARLHDLLADKQSQKLLVQGELQETREHFQKFIDVVKPFNLSESKYVLPPTRSFKEPGKIVDST